MPVDKPSAPKESVFKGVTLYHWLVVLIASAGWLFDVTGSYNGVFLAVIVLLVGASIVSWAVQERRYSLKYQTATVG